MDTTTIRNTLKAFIKKYRTEFQAMTSRETALLELGALVMTSEHYRLMGYKVEIENSKQDLFSVKLSSRGHPYNFSWFRCSLKGVAFEIHSNLAISGAHKDGAVYVVDIAVVRENVVPREKGKVPWVALSNRDLITFAEVKKLVIYPMLLAQFVGIVHEIRPIQLGGKPRGFKKHKHFYPALISLGYLQGTSKK